MVTPGLIRGDCRRKAAVHSTTKNSHRLIGWEVADIFRQYGNAYCEKHALPASHLRIMRAIKVCRTAYLGGHVEACTYCGFQRNAYNSCRNRHCPKCQSLAKARWLAARKAELLPVRYFHNVFTLPHELNALILSNKRVLLSLLFKTVSATLLEFGRNNLGGQIGFITILHTWDQRLLDHFHLHCLIPAGALSFDQQRWISVEGSFLFPVKALSKVFRGKFLSGLKRLYQTGQLLFPGHIAHLHSQSDFKALLDCLYEKAWVVYSKGSIAESSISKKAPNPKTLLDYLASYTHRVAISNHRIESICDGQVTFRYKDRRQNDASKMMALNAEEFIRRFLLHILPKGFMRIRHYGFLGNRYKKKALRTCRKLLGMVEIAPLPVYSTTGELMKALTGNDIRQCPCCKQISLRRIQTILPEYQRRQVRLNYWDSS
jgi:hypothetical protein